MDLKIVKAPPRSGDNHLVDYDAVIEALPAEGWAELGPYDTADAHRVARTFKKLGGVKVVTRQTAESGGEQRSVYVAKTDAPTVT